MRLLAMALTVLLVGWIATSRAPSVEAAEATPETKILLTVTGRIAAPHGPKGATFDLAALRALPQTTFQTATIWTEGRPTFTGVSLRKLLDAVGASGRSIHAVALNDYAVDIPAADAVEGGPIVAYEIDGKALPVRNRGPLWIVYPYDARADYRSEVIYARSIWQLDRIEIRD
ncbi:molybdopterin-dependent oxidoreductase [Pinisolibacter aquiterrae]|uniref:molybdopterin-dependent oxidoreductase n=1 Tax=Pinisolibacter aquiterrae TaxID=2815579 RepID=UPI001E5C1477|nr:molybdopterin-dependent oxidoreductase [Pinisolibacter aquiterrae]MCC8237085.1 molybdopterin-dependent oxidoreductase [Pinisolibacter aquiterrae]